MARRRCRNGDVTKNRPMENVILAGRAQFLRDWDLVAVCHTDRGQGRRIAGSWVSDECYFYQDPTHDLDMTHFCSSHNHPRYKAH
jgi:hypothetical protein